MVITFDDDIIFHPKSVERAYKKHLKYPKAIVANQVTSTPIDHQNESILPYDKWESPTSHKLSPSLSFSLLTGSGCLYPYGLFPKEFFSKDDIMKYAPTTDDIWVSLMAVYYNIQKVGTDEGVKVYTTISNSQVNSLSRINAERNSCDKSVRHIIKDYPAILERIRNYNNI